MWLHSRHVFSYPCDYHGSFASRVVLNVVVAVVVVVNVAVGVVVSTKIWKLEVKQFKFLA